MCFFSSSQPQALKADGTLMPLRFSQIKLHFFIVGKFVEPNEICLMVIFLEDKRGRVISSQIMTGEEGKAMCRIYEQPGEERARFG